MMMELLKEIEYNDGVFPEEKLRSIINQKDEAIPYLLDIVREVKDNPEKYIKEQNNLLHIYAVYLLAQFRVAELYPLFVDLLRLPGDIPDQIFGDVVTESAGKILASVYDGNIRLLKELIEDSNADVFARSAGTSALAILALHNRLPRAEVLNYFRELLNRDKNGYNNEMIALIIYNCYVLYPEEIYTDIEKAYAEGRVDKRMISIDDVKSTLESGMSEVLENSRSNIHLQYINDTISGLKKWACFYKDAEKRSKERMAEMERLQTNPKMSAKSHKIRRNDPCPCGSGKKYKKCCMDRFSIDGN